MAGIHNGLIHVKRLDEAALRSRPMLVRGTEAACVDAIAATYP